MELQILDMIQSIRIPILDKFFVVFTTLGNHGEIWFAIIIVMLFTKKYRKIAIFAIAALLLEVVMVEGIIKNIFARPRPFIADGSFQLLIPIPSGYSFPSGHTASSFAIAGVLWFNKVPYRKTIMTLAALMGFSRLYLYVHYPSDVIVGAILGLLIGWVVVYIQRKYYTKESIGGSL